MKKPIRFSCLIVLVAITLSACVTVDPSRPEVKVREAVNSRVAAGLQYLQQGDPAEARRHFSRALSLDDRSAMAHNAMALLYNYEQDPEMEEHHYRRALRSDRRYSPALNNYAILRYSRGEYEQALEMFTRAANDPSYEGRGSAWANIGRCHLQLGDENKAREAFTRSLRLNPNAVLVNLELAQLDLNDGRYPRGWGYYQQYLQRTSAQTARALWVGIQLADALGHQDELSSYELALENLYPRSAEFQQWQRWKTAKESR